LTAVRRALLCILAAVAIGGCGGGEETTTSTAAPATSSTQTSSATTSSTPEPATSTTTGSEPEEGGGGSGGVAAESPGADPESALEAFVSGDPDLVCGELATEALIADAYGDEQGCRAAQAPGATPSSIEIVEIETSGDTTEAVVIPEGGPNGGFEHEVVLVREGDTWLVDSLKADIPAGP
jgi:hypothetical protein